MTTIAAVTTPSLAIVEGHATTTSQQIAEHFGKRHDAVLRTIRNLLVDLPEDYRLRNFVETVESRENPSGGAPIASPAYRITRDGFVLLAMGFTGKQALQWKVAYIEAFNQMEAKLREPSVPALSIEAMVREAIANASRPAPLPRLDFERPPAIGTYKYDRANPYPRNGRGAWDHDRARRSSRHSGKGGRRDVHGALVPPDADCAQRAV